VATAALVAIFPFVFSMYQTNIMITALIYVVVGLGLNIVVGLAGLLDLGLCGLLRGGRLQLRPAELPFRGHLLDGTCPSVPVGGLSVRYHAGLSRVAAAGRLPGHRHPGFGEIIRLVLENWNEFSFGPSGIANIPRPGLFGLK
jgi:branched-chain amino acid transport system permease protein